MFMIKQVARSEERGRDRERLAKARGRATVPTADLIVARMLEVLQPVLPAHGQLRDALEAALTSWIAAELAYTAKLDKPAGALADFYEAVDERMVRFTKLLAGVFGGVVGALPDAPSEAGVLGIEVPLIDLVRDGKGLLDGVVQAIVATHFDGSELQLGAGLAVGVVERMCRLSGMSEEEARLKPLKVKWPRDLDVSNVELTESYLGATALAKLLLTPLPVKISDKVRMEHMLITGGAGHGKSQLLQHMIARDLDRPKGGEVGMVVIDSQGDLINRIQRLERFADRDRLLLVDASDVEYPVALNVFDLGGVRLDSLPPREREQAMAATVQLYEYVIGGLFGAELTSKQSVVFRFLIRLMLSIPGATIHTLRQCLEEPKDFLHHMERQPETSRRFFTREFLDKQFNDTRKQILRRLYGVLQNPAFERMFAASENRVDLGAALNAGRVVLCNTSREFLQDECRVFGRYCIALAMKAAFDRARMPQEQRRTSFLVIDEASDYFDESVGQLLVQARKYKLGVVLAHQALEQLSDGLKALVMSNTSLKLAGGVSARDARALAADMKSTPEFLLAQQKDAGGTRFATFVRNTTPGAVSWRVPFGTMEKMPAMSDEAFARVLARNRAEISIGASDLGAACGDGAGAAAGGGADERGGGASAGVVTGDFSEAY